MVVDFCAGAGGKTLRYRHCHAATPALYAFDTSAHRLDALKPRLAQQTVRCAPGRSHTNATSRLAKRLASKIDRVLVDAAPGLGTLRLNPDLKWRQSPKTSRK